MKVADTIADLLKLLDAERATNADLRAALVAVTRERDEARQTSDRLWVVLAAWKNMLGQLGVEVALDTEPAVSAVAALTAARVPDSAALLALADELTRLHGEDPGSLSGLCYRCREAYPCSSAHAAAALRAAAHEQDRLAAIETAANGVAHYWGGGGPGMRYTSGAWTPDFAEAMTALKAALLAAPSDAAGDTNLGPPIVVDGIAWANPRITTMGLNDEPPDMTGDADKDGQP